MFSYFYQHHYNKQFPDQFCFASRDPIGEYYFGNTGPEMEEAEALGDALLHLSQLTELDLSGAWSRTSFFPGFLGPLFRLLESPQAKRAKRRREHVVLPLDS